MPLSPFCTTVALLLDLAYLCGWPEEFRGAARPDGAVFLVQVAYPDCSPILILSEASLTDLNTRLEKKVKMDQFRPNIVVTGCDAFEEVSGSLLLCVTLRCAVQDTNGIAVTFSQRQLRPSGVGGAGKLLPQVTFPLSISSRTTAAIFLLASGGDAHPVRPRPRSKQREIRVAASLGPDYNI